MRLYYPTYSLVTPPATEPITAATLAADEFMRGVNFTLPSELSLFDPTLIPSAREKAEQVTARKLISQTWDMSLSVQPNAIYFPFGQLTAVDSVTTILEDGTEVVEDSDIYSVSLGDGGILWPKSGNSWTTTQRVFANFVIRFTCGWPDAASLPASIRHAIMILVQFYYDNREGVNNVPDEFTSVINMHKIFSI